MRTSKANYIQKDTWKLYGMWSTCGTSRITKAASSDKLWATEWRARRNKRHKHLSDRFDKGEYVTRETTLEHIAHLRQHCHNSKFVIFQEKYLKVLKCYNFIWVQRRHNCSPAASSANCVMPLYLLKVQLQTFLSYTNNSKCQIFSCDTPFTNELYFISQRQK